MSETLTPPAAEQHLSLDAEAVPPEQRSIEERPNYDKLSLVNDFNNYSAISTYRNPDRVNTGDRQHAYRQEALVEDPETGKSRVEERYDLLVKASKLEAFSFTFDHGSETVEAPSTDSIVFKLGCLSSSFREASSKGYFNSYSKLSEGANMYSQPITVRQPQILERADIDSLLESPEEDKITVLSELLDPHRLQHDQDAPEPQKLAAETEKKYIVEVLNSLEPSFRKDLLLVEGWKYFSHENIDEPETAQALAHKVSEPALGAALLEYNVKFSAITAESVHD